MRPPCVSENGQKKGAWSEEEDNKLRAYVHRYGHWNWRLLPKFAGLDRCGKSCRLRWMNYLKPGIKRGNYSKEEEDLIVQLHHKLGNKWSAIAENLPGRTDNDIKNHWHSHLKKHSKRTKPVSQVVEKLPGNFMPEEALTYKSRKLELESAEVSDHYKHILDTPSGSNSWINNPVGPANCDSDASTASSSSLPDHQEVWTISSFLSEQTNYQLFQGQLNDERVDFEETFWTEPFVMDHSYGQEYIFSSVDEGSFFSFDLFT